MKKLTEKEIKKIQSLLDQGCSIRETADKSGHDKNTILKYKKMGVEKQNPPIFSNQNGCEVNPDNGYIQNGNRRYTVREIQEIPRILHSTALPLQLAQFPQEKHEGESEKKLEKIVDEYRKRENERLKHGVNQYKALIQKQKEINQQKIKSRELAQLKFEMENLKADYDFLDRSMSSEFSKSNVQHDGFSDGEQNQIFKTARKEHGKSIQHMNIHDQQNQAESASIEIAEDKDFVNVSSCSHQAEEVLFSNSTKNTGSSPKRSESTACKVDPENPTFSVSDIALLAVVIECGYKSFKKIVWARQYIQNQRQSAPQWLIVTERKNEKQIPSSTRVK